MSKAYKTNKVIIILISIVLSIIGIAVQMEWGKALFPESVQHELRENILLVIFGIFLCCILMIVACQFGSNKAIVIVSVWTILLLLLSCSPLVQSINGIRRLRLGPIVVRFSLMVPWAYIFAVSGIVDLFGKKDEKAILVIISLLVELFMISAWIFDSTDRLWYTLPWITYFLLFPYMKKHRWYYVIPVAFLLIYFGRIIAVSFKAETDIFYYRDRVIAGWLHPNSEVYAGTNNYFMSEIRAIIQKGSLFGSRGALAADKISYRDGASLMPIGLYQRYGLIGCIITIVLYFDMCRRIIKNGMILVKTGNLYHGTLCKGVGIFLILSAVLSIVSEFYILPLISAFEFPFLCVSGFQPIWFLYLTMTFIEFDVPEEKQNIICSETASL